MSKHSSFAPPQRTLMGPGPSDVPERILQALARPTIGHLDPAFVEMMDQIKGFLQEAFITTNPLTIPVSAPGSAGMEACFFNLLEPGDKVIVCQNGVFGQRMQQVAERAGAHVVAVEFPWGQTIDPETVRTTIKLNPDAKVLAFVHSETSTGVLADAESLCALAREHGMLTIVDTVTSLGGVPLYVDEWGIDATYSGTQKCLSVPPGLSPVSFSDKAAELIKQRRTPVKSWFLDMNLVMGYWGSGARAYHHTAPINALYGLHEGLVMLLEEGLEASWERHRKYHKALVAGLSALGLNIAVDETFRLPQLNVVEIPEGVADQETRSRLLNEYGLEIGAGLGSFAGKVWRIGLMGYGANRGNVMKCLDALGRVLFDGKAAQEAVSEAEKSLADN